LPQWLPILIDLMVAGPHCEIITSPNSYLPKWLPALIEFVDELKLLKYIFYYI